VTHHKGSDECSVGSFREDLSPYLIVEVIPVSVDR